MRPPVPYPAPTRAIRPGLWRRAAFFALGLLAVLTRAATAPRRRRFARRRVGAGGADVRRVCIVEPYGMGDAFLLQPLVRAWLDAGAEVSLAARHAWEPLFPKHERFSFVPFEPSWAAPVPSPGRKYRRPARDLSRAARTLRPFAKGAIGIDPRGDPRAVMALYLAGAAHVRTLPVYWSATDCAMPPLAAHFVPLDKDVSRRLVSRAFAPKDASYGFPSLAHLGFPRRPHASPPPPVSPDSPVGLLPLTPWEGKRWPRSRWGELLAIFRRRGIPALLLCGPGERSAALAAIGAGDGEEEGTDCAALSSTPVLEASDVADWARLLSRLSALVTVNTGPMHLADAMGVPLVVLDGASRLPLWAPESESSVVLHRQDLVPQAPFHPTSRNGLAVQSSVMSLVSADDVMRAISALGVAANRTLSDRR